MFTDEIKKLNITAVKQPVKLHDSWLVDIHHFCEKTGPHIKTYEFEEFERAVAAYEAAHDEMLEQRPTILERKGCSLIDILQVLAICVIISLLVTILGIGKAHASGQDDVVKERIVNAIIGEAEGEPYKGKLAVACAIQNRVQKFGSFDKAMKGVYGEKAPRVKGRKYSAKVFVDAVRAYEESLDVGTCDFIDGADHWEGSAFKTPGWAQKMELVVVIGRQRFYKTREER